MAKLWVELEVTRKGDLIFKNVKDDVANLNKHLDYTEKAAKRVALGIDFIVVRWAALKIKAMIKDFTSLYEELEKADLLFKQSAINVRKYSDEFYRGSLRMAKSLQDITGVHRSAIEMGMRLLITFDEITNNMLPRATQAMLDYAAFTGVSMESAAKAIGKASHGLLGDLKRVGVQVSEATYHAKGFVGILEEIEKQMGKQAETFGKTTAGQWRIWANDVKDLKIAVGELADIFLVKTGFLSGMTKELRGFTEWLEKWKDQTDIELMFKGIALSVLEVAEAMAYLIDSTITGWRMLGIEKAIPGLKLLFKSGEAMAATTAGYMLGRYFGDEVAEQWLYNYSKLTEDEIAKIVKDLKQVNTLETKRLGLSEAILRIQKEIESYSRSAGANQVNNILVITPLMKIWEDFTTDSITVFKNAWVKVLSDLEINFSSLAAQIRGVMAKSVIDTLWNQMITIPFTGTAAQGFTKTAIGPNGEIVGPNDQFRIMGGTGYTPSGSPVFIGTPSTQTQIPLSNALMAGAGAYSAYQGGNPISGGITGAMAGGLVGGIPGALGGSFLGTVLGFAGKKKEIEQTYNLTWEIIDGQLELIGEVWKNSPRSKEVIATAKEALEAQIKIFNQIALVSKAMGFDVNVPSTYQIGTKGTQQERIKYFMENVEELEGIFPGAQKIKEKIQLGIETGLLKYTPEVWTEIDKYFEEFEAKYEEFGNFVANTLGNALVESLKTGKFDTFKDTLKQGLYESTVQAFSQAFIDRYMMSMIGEAFNVNSLLGVMSAYGAGNMSEADAISQIRTIFSGLATVFDQMRPIWEEINAGMSTLALELNLNTEALRENLEGLRDYIMTVQDTIAGLTVSDLAPALNYKVFQAEYERLLGGAGTQEGLNDFVRYIQSEYLPFMKDYSTNYEQTFNKVIDELSGLGGTKKDEVMDILYNIYVALGGGTAKSASALLDLIKDYTHGSATTLFSEEYGLRGVIQTIIDNKLDEIGITEASIEKLASKMAEKVSPLIGSRFVTQSEFGSMVGMGEYTQTSILNEIISKWLQPLGGPYSPNVTYTVIDGIIYWQDKNTGQILGPAVANVFF